MSNAESLVSEKQIIGQSVTEITNMSNSEVVVIESIEVRELLRFP